MNSPSIWYKLAIIVFAFFLSRVSVQGSTPHHEFTIRTDSLFLLSDSTQKTIVSARKSARTVYQATTVKTISCSLEEALYVLDNFNQTAPQLPYVRKFKHLTEAMSKKNRRSFLLVVGIPLAVSWFVGEMPEPQTTGEGEVFYRLNKIDCSLEAASYASQTGGLIKVRYHSFQMYFRLKRIGTDRTRIMLTSFVEPTIWIPRWLYRIVAKKVFPDMLSGFEEIVFDNRGE